MSGSPFEPNIWQIIRSSQKDEQYINSLDADLNLSIKQLFGIRSWIRIQSLLTSCNKFVFYLLTNVSGSQTLGEEYCHLIQVTAGQERSVPSRVKRLSQALLYSFQQTLLNKFVTQLHRLSRTLFISNYSVEELRRDIQYVLHILQALNLTVFYTRGTYFDLTKRLVSIRYLSTYQRESSLDTSHILSYLSLLYAVLSLYSKYNLRSQSSPTLGENPLSDALSSEAEATFPLGSQSKCLLCFSKRTSPTLLECGHIFCWNCLTKWLQYKDECPTCRRAVKSNRLVFLHNYS